MFLIAFETGSQARTSDAGSDYNTDRPHSTFNGRPTSLCYAESEEKLAA